MSMPLPNAHELLPWLLLLLLLLLVKHLLPRKNAMGSSPLPCPRGLPVVGNLHQIGELPHVSLAALAERHGPLMLLQLGSVPALVVSSAAAARAVLGCHDLALSGRPALYAATRLSYGLLTISFAPPGEFWRAARRTCVSELLGAPRVRSFCAAREAEAAALVAAVSEVSRTGAVVNMSQMLLATTNKIIRRIAFGDDEATGEESGELIAILDETQRLLGGFWVADYMPWLGWADAARGLRRRLEKNFRDLDAFYERAIDEHLKKRAGSDEQPDEHDDLIDVLLRLHGDPVHRRTFSTRNHIKGVLTDMFIAGTGTSAAALEWTMTELMRHPGTMAKAQHEVRSAVRDKATVQEDDLPSLHYLKLVIKESMRLHPPAPLLVPRETVAACTVRGRDIPPGTRVLINAKAIGMDAEAWAQQERFWPERFEGGGGGGRDGLVPDFGLVPFGVGRRSCPGAQFAAAVMELVLANLLYCFDWELPPGAGKEKDKDLEEEVGLTVHRKNHLFLLAKRR